MASMMRKARDFLGWGARDAEEYVDNTLTEFYDTPQPTADIVAFPQQPETPELADPSRFHTAVSEARVMENFRIETVNPTTYEDSRTIGDYFRKNIPVVVNISDMSDGEARRIIDFISGLTYGLDGKAERITNRVFLLTPKTVEVGGYAGTTLR